MRDTRSKKPQRGRRWGKKVKVWSGEERAKQRTVLQERKANWLRSRIMPEHKKLIQAPLRSKKKLTEKQLAYGRILVSSKITAGKTGDIPLEESTSWNKRDNSFLFRFKIHGYQIQDSVPVALVGSSSAALEICRKAYKFARRITREWTLRAGCMTPPSPHLFIIAKMSIRKYINRKIYKHLTK